MKKGELRREKVNLIIVGNQNSGKTSLINKFLDGDKTFSHLYNPTIGINLQKRNIIIDNCEVTVCIWDTAGQEKFFSLTKSYFRKADGVLVIFDLTDKNSFDKMCNFWLQEVRESTEKNSSQIIIGNKVDCENERAITTQEAKKVADSIDTVYFEASAKTGLNVKEAIQNLVRQCLAKISNEGSEQGEEVGQVVELSVQNEPAERNGCFGSAQQMFGKFFNKMKRGNQVSI